jgi:hypothetical protein
MMAERFKEGALAGSHTWPATAFMQALIECGGVPPPAAAVADAPTGAYHGHALSVR